MVNIHTFLSNSLFHGFRSFARKTFLAPKAISFVLLVSVIFLFCRDAFGAEEKAVAGDNAAPETHVIHVELQPWQKRRVAFIEIIRGLQKKDAGAIAAFDKILTEFETCPMCLTPMENMDILGAFYVPKDGIEACLPAIVMNAALGWYDALRFGSESGRAEISFNEGFFKKALILSDDPKGQRSLKFFFGQPKRTAELVDQGLAFAEKYKDGSSYDHRWPTAYGLEQMICAQGGSCSPPKELPEDRWDQAWNEAKQKVVRYYKVK